MSMTSPTAPTVQNEGRSPTQAANEPLVVRFQAGIPGFEGCHRFVLVASEDLSPLGCLRALDPPEPSFLVIDPQLLRFRYDMTLNDAERARLSAADNEALLWLAIVTVTADGATANLRAPVVINPRAMIGCQVIRDDAADPVEFPIHLG